MTRYLGPLLVLIAGAIDAHAQWTASGRFFYTDRLYTTSGWTTTRPAPIRWADVQIVDASSSAVLATGYSNEAGAFSIPVPDEQPRTVVARVITTSLAVPGLFLEVSDDTLTPRPAYGLASGAQAHAAGPAGVDFGDTLAPLATGSGPPYTELISQAFNAYDMGVYMAQWVEFVEGSRPTRLLQVGWNPNRDTPRTGSSYGGGRLNLSDDDGYDDSNILHEMGHYIDSTYSRSNSPGGSHTISDPYQDPRLSWGEGLATFFSGAILQHFSLPAPHIYSDRNSFGTTGGFYYQFESVSSSSQKGVASEVGVTAALYDIIDSSDTEDSISGDDDDLAEPDGAPWSVLRDFRDSPPSIVTIEDFWDRWFSTGRGRFTEMKDIFYALEMRYYADDYEPDDSPAAARLIAPGQTQSRTFYPFSDEDWSYFDNVGSETQFRIRTNGSNLGLNNPVIDVFGPDANTRVGHNVYENSSKSNNQNCELLFVTPQVGRYYIRVTRLGGSYAPDTLYGHYDLVFSSVNLLPSVTRVMPRTIPAGGKATVSIQGQNFTYHMQPNIWGGDVAVKSYEVLYPELLAAEVEVAATASPGPRDLTVIGLDGRYYTLSGAMTVGPPSGGSIVVNEIRLADGDGSPAAVVELANRGPNPQALTGWKLTAARNSTGVTTFDQFAGVTLYPGVYLQVLDTAGSNDAEHAYDNANTMAWPLLRDGDGAVELRNAAGELVDYVRYNRNARYPRSVRTEPGDAGWGKPDASGVNSTSTSLGRDRVSHDSNQGYDWLLSSSTLGRANGGAAFTNTPTPVGYPGFIAVSTPTPTPSPTVTPTFHPGDVNRDHALDDVDLFLFASSWQVDSASIPVIQKPGAPPASAGRGQGEGRSREGFPFLLYGDLDGSGFVDQADLLLFVEYWADRPR